MNHTRVRFALFALASLIFDQVSKRFADVWLAAGRSLDVIPGYLRLAHVRNTGAVFGMLSATQSPLKEILLSAIAVLALGIMVYYFLRYPLERRVFHIGLGMVFGGAAGNIVDRVTRGHVVDFIDLHIKDHFTWPTFNLADCAICVGIGLMILDMHRSRTRRDAGVPHVS